MISYSTTFSNDGISFILINTSNTSKVIEINSNYNNRIIIGMNYMLIMKQIKRYI